MNLQKIQEEWQEDCQINQNALDDASLDSARLHSKYLELFNKARLILKKKETDLEILKHKKWLYYSGKMSKEEMDELEWDYDPFNGVAKPMKSELASYITSDAEVVEAKLSVDYQKVTVEALEEILNNIRWRSSNIKNIIDWRKFTAGI